MRNAVVEMRKPNGKNVFHKLLSDKRKNETENPDASKFGYVLNSYEILEDEAFRYVSSVPFTPMKPTVPTTCKICKEVIGSVYHE